VDARPSAARIRLPRARHGRSLPRCGELTFRDTCAASAPGPGTWKDPDPRRRSSRDQGGSEQACLPANGGSAAPAACPVSATSCRHGLRRTCRRVTGRSHRPRSTWPDCQRRLSRRRGCRPWPWPGAGPSPGHAVAALALACTSRSPAAYATSPAITPARCGSRPPRARRNQGMTRSADSAWSRSPRCSPGYSPPSSGRLALR
jgi:hypothetical protein